MGTRFAELAFTPSVEAEQERRGTRAAYARLARMPGRRREVLGAAEAGFISERDSFYLASVSETGWPYVQHRGGPPGFVRVLGPSRIGFAEYEGNGQFITLGNLRTNDRVALIFLDYPARRRLKLLGHARVVDAAREPELLAQLDSSPEVELGAALVIEVEAADWNCPQYITPRYTEAEIRKRLAPVLQRLEVAERELAKLKGEPR